MPDKLHIDNIDPERASQCILSIRLSANGFSVFVHHPVSGVVVLSTTLPVNPNLSIAANYKQILKELEFLSFAYKQVDVTFASKRFTLLPNDLFEEEHAETMFYYNFARKENEVVCYNTLDRNNATLLFAMDKTLYDVLTQQHGQMNVFASVSAPAETFAARSQFGCKRKMYVCIHPQTMEIYAFEHSNLQLLNLYECEADEDRMYYLLYAWKQLNMNQMEDELHISYAENGSEALLKDLERFVKHVTITEQNFTL